MPTPPTGFTLDTKSPELPPGFRIDESEEHKLNFAQRVGRDLEARVDTFEVIKSAVERGETSFAASILQVVGKIGFGSVLDLLGEGFVSLSNSVNLALGLITPDIIEDPLVNGVRSAGHLFLDTKAGQAGMAALESGTAAWQDYKEENPSSARNIEASLNIALILSPVRIRGKPSGPTVFGPSGERLVARGQQQVIKERAAFIDDLVAPKQTAAVRTEQVSRTVEVGGGPTRRNVVTLDAADRAAADEVARSVHAVKPGMTLQGSRNAISNKVFESTSRLQAALDRVKTRFSRVSISEELALAAERIRAAPLLIGKAKTVALRMVTEMEKILSQFPNTLGGMLRGRKKFDDLIREQKGKSAFDPKLDNALTISLREVRQSVNSFIANNAPTSIAVRPALRQQSNLFRAMENIAPKAAEEANSAVMRVWRRVLTILPLRGEGNQLLALGFGVGGLGAAAMFAPFIRDLAVITAGLYIGGRVVLSPSMKIALGRLLKHMDAMAVVPAERAAIVELLKSAQEQ